MRKTKPDTVLLIVRPKYEGLPDKVAVACKLRFLNSTETMQKPAFFHFQTKISSQPGKVFPKFQNILCSKSSETSISAGLSAQKRFSPKLYQATCSPLVNILWPISVIGKNRVFFVFALPCHGFKKNRTLLLSFERISTSAFQNTKTIFLTPKNKKVTAISMDHSQNSKSVWVS